MNKKCYMCGDRKYTTRQITSEETGNKENPVCTRCISIKQPGYKKIQAERKAAIDESKPKSQSETVAEAIAYRERLQKKWDRYAKAIKIVNVSSKAWRKILTSTELTLENKEEILDESGAQIVTSGTGKVGIMVTIMNEDDPAVVAMFSKKNA